MDINGFDNYSVHILRPQNTESDELQLNLIGDKYQDKNDFILHNNLSDAILNQITDMIN